MSSWRRTRQAVELWRRAVEPLELVELHQGVGGSDLRRLEVVARVVEHEDEVVRGAVGERAEALALAPPGAELVGLAAPAPAAQRHAAVELVVVVQPDEAAVAGRGDGVPAGEARHRDVDARSRALAAQPGVEHVAGVLDDPQSVGVGDGTDGVPVGAVAHEVGGRTARVRGPIISSMASTSIW